MILALISHRFGFTSHWSVGPVDKSPFGRRFSIHGFAQILSLQQWFSLSFAAIDISLHANYALILLNTNCTNYTNMLLSLERIGRFGRFVFKNQHSTLFFKSHTDLTDLTDFFRCKQRFVYHQDCVSTIFQVVTPISFFEKCYICSPPQYRSALVVARMRNIVFILLLRGLPQGKCPSEAVCSKMELTSLVSAFFHP